MTALVQQQQQPESHYADPSLNQPVANMQQPETAKHVTVYVNGDKYNPGKRFVVNRKHIADFDGFMNMVTSSLRPSFGAVRNIYTPMHGHKVTQLDGINNGMSVVAGGVERFRRLQYQEISPPTIKHSRPRNYAEIRPVYHNTRMNVAARWKDVAKGPCHIYVYGNGDINGSAVRLLLIPRIMKQWDMVLQEVTEKLASRTGQACRRLYTLHGEMLHSADQLENGRYYVSVGNERFKRLPYGERAQHMAMMQQHAKKPQVQLPPIRRRVRTLNSTKPDDSSYSQKYAVRRQMQEERGQYSQPPPGGRPPPNRKLRPLRGPAPPPSSETESVFHAKPVKVKRSGASGKLTQVSTMENDDDVFRARQGVVRAEEVDDDENTKVDLPIDQVPAEPVEDEEDLDLTMKVVESDARERSPSPQQRTTYATRIEEDDSERTEPSKTPTSASREGGQPQHQPSPRVEEDQTEPNGEVVQQSEQPETERKPSPLKSKTRDEAAVAIQASYRGYLVRKDLRRQKKADNSAAVERLFGEEKPHTPASDNPDERQSPAPAAVESDAGPIHSDLEETHREEIVLLEETEDKEAPIVKEPSRPASTESPTLVATPTNDEQNNIDDIKPVESSDVPEGSPMTSSRQAEEQSVSYEQETPSQLPVSENEPTDAAKPSEIPYEPHQDGLRPPSQLSAKNDVEAQPSGEESGLPERDAGDGTDHNEAEDQEPKGEASMNGDIQTTASLEIKTNQNSESRPDSVTENGVGGHVEHVPKSQPDVEQIPNGQPTIIDGDV